MNASNVSERIAAELDTLTSEQRSALLKLLEKDGIDIGKYQTIQPRCAGEPVPLSYQQQRLWFLAQLEESSSHYNIPLFLRITGVVNTEALIRAVEAVVSRHEILRTRFTDRDGQLQQVLDDEPFVVRVLDLRDLKELDELCSAEASYDFDLSAGKLIRVVLAKHLPEENFLLVTCHHSVSDGWSNWIFFRELAQSYAGYAGGRSPALPALQVQYADYAAWQRKWLTGPILQSQLDYWKQQLAGLPPLIELPADRPRPAVKTYRGASEHFSYPAELLGELNALSKRQGTTLYMTLLAAFFVLLYRYTGLTDLAVGSPIANRNRRELEGLIGFFVNMIVMRGRVSGDMTFLELLSQVKTTAVDAYERQDVPFEYLVEEVSPARSLSYSPFFQLVFALHNVPAAGITLDGVEISKMSHAYEVAKFDLGLYVHETADGLRCTAQFNTNLFDRATIRRLSAHYRQVLAAMVANPHGQIGQFDYLTDAERVQLFDEWNATERSYRWDKTLSAFFEEQAARTPEKVAVATMDEQLTYAELRARSRRVAFELVRHGVSPGELVGVVIGKGCAQVAAVIGVMLSGAAYLPVDVTWPMDRQRAVLAAGQCRVVVSTSDLISEADWPENLSVVDIRRLSEGAPESFEAHTFPQVAATDLAYVIFTSGSTGIPKGVMIEHGSAVNTLLEINERFGVTSNDSVLALSSLAFDLSVYDLFGLLSVGGTVVVPRDEDRLDPSMWWSLLRKFGVTVWNTVPAVFQLLVDFLETKDLTRRETAESSLRLSLLSGDWVPVELPRRAKELMPALKIISLGGATEASIWSNCYPIDDVTVSRRSIPYGKPLGNQRFYILDDALLPCPIGVPGNLYIGGVGLARGYWGDEGQTSASFIEHAALGQRLYRTGDMGRWLADGNMEFLGRRDGQVKLRGFRIELGEIESRLCKHRAVQACVVVMRDDRQGTKSIAAYVVAQPDSTQFTALRDSLREFLERTLPSYMVPSAFLFVPGLPLTANGKVDRNALPAPETSQTQEHHVAPRSQTEREMCEIWRSILGLERVGVTDNFFAVGGHSLNSVQLLRRIHQRFGANIDLHDIFRSPTVAELARVVEGKACHRSRSPALLCAGKPTCLFFVHTIFGDSEHYVPLANLLAVDMSIYALHIFDQDLDVLRTMSMQELAARHVETIRKEQPTGPYRLAGHSVGGVIGYEMARQLRLAGEDVSFLGLIDTYSRTNLGRKGDGSGSGFSDNFLPALVMQYDPAADKALIADIRSTAGNDPRLFFDEAKRHGLIPPSLGFEEANTHYRFTLALMRIAAEYVPPPIDVQVTLFAAEESLAVAPTLRWSEEVMRGWRMHVVGGNHVSIMRPPNIQPLADKMANELGRPHAPRSQSRAVSL